MYQRPSKAGRRMHAARSVWAWVLPLATALCAAPALAADPAKGSEAHIRAVTGKVDGASIRANTRATKDWPSYGLDHAETRFSKLKEVNDANVAKLGLAWTYDLESTRGVEATPLVVDGIMYVTASWSVVHAVDVRTGKRLWTFDPKVSRAIGFKGCCDVVNRGVAMHKGKVYVGAYDGRLIALDAATGAKVWEQDTIIDHKRSYTITYFIPQASRSEGSQLEIEKLSCVYEGVPGAVQYSWKTGNGLSYGYIYAPGKGLVHVITRARGR